MAFNIKKFIEFTGFSYDASSRSSYGDFYGLKCSVDLSPDAQYLYMKFYVNENSRFEQNIGYEPSGVNLKITNDLEELAKTHKKIVVKKTCIYEPHVIKITLFGRKCKTENIGALMNDVLTLCREKNLISCCDKCGNDVKCDYYRINDMTTYLCDGCYDNVVSDLSLNESVRAEVPSNMPLGIIGSIIGALIIFLLTFIFYKIGYIVYITGAVGVIAGLFLYNKFSGKITKLGAIITIIICLVSSVLTGVFCIAKEISDIYREDLALYNEYVSEYNWIMTSSDDEYDIYYDEPKEEIVEEYIEYLAEFGEYIDAYKGEESIGYCMIHIISIINDFDKPGEIFGELLELILWNFITVLIGGLCSFKGIINMAEGKFETRKLT